MFLLSSYWCIEYWLVLCCPLVFSLRSDWMAIFVTFKTKDTMKSFFILLSLYYFLVVNVVSADSVTFPSRVEIVMDEDFDLPGGPGECSSFYSFSYSFFSIFEWWPFHWFGILSIDRWSGNCNFSEWECCLLLCWEYRLSYIMRI